MIGKYVKSSFFLVLLIVNCLKSTENPKKGPCLWLNFKRGIKCGMSEIDFFNHCDSCRWTGVVGTTGYGYRKRFIISNDGDTSIGGYRTRTYLSIGSEKDSAKIYAEFSDSTGEFILNRYWFSKEDLATLRLKTKKELGTDCCHK